MGTKTQGFGFEKYGDPFGFGGPLLVLRARAIESQTVRVAFNEIPLSMSAAGPYDGLNPANYSVSILIGVGMQPQVIATKTLVIPGPAIALAATEYGIDIQTDRALLTTLTYRVTVRNVVAQAGGALGAPATADFLGVWVLALARDAASNQGIVDLFSDPLSDGYAVDSGGDIALHGGAASYEKRVRRRVLTPKNSYSFLPGYGVDLHLKQPLSTTHLIAIKQDIIKQIMLEPETAKVEVSLSKLGDNILSILVSAFPKTGSGVEVGVKIKDGLVIS